MNQDDVSTAGAGHDVCGVVHEAILETRFISQQQRYEWHVASDVGDPLDRSRRGWALLIPDIIVTAAHAAVLSALSFADHPSPLFAMSWMFGDRLRLEQSDRRFLITSDSNDLFRNIFRRQNEIDAAAGNGMLRHVELDGGGQLLGDRDAAHLLDSAQRCGAVAVVAGNDHGDQLAVPELGE